MKTSVLAIMLACALAAGAQDGSQGQPQPAAPGKQAAPAGPEIKDPAEYNAYVSAVQQQNPTAKTSALEAFLTQYPNSVMKTTALEQLMATYQQAGNQSKVVETATRLLQADPCNLRGLALITFISRQSVAAGQNTPQNLPQLTQYANKGVECIKTQQKPAGVSEADWDNLKKQVGPIFEGGAGFAALQNKDNANAQTHLLEAVKAQPNDIQNVYPLALAYTTANPPDMEKGLFFLARAANLAEGTAGGSQIHKYLEAAYKNYHGSDEGLDTLLATAKSNPLPPADLKITKYVPPTPAQQAHDLVKDKTPDQIKQLSFGEWELVLAAGLPEDQDKVWSVIKSVPLQMEGNVIETASPTELHIAGSEDDIEQKRPDITLTMSGPIPTARLPKAGDTFDFEGTPLSYTATPFMMMMGDGKLLKKGGEPAAKRPVHRRTARKPPQ
jgi:hypothetical protein